MGPDPLLCRIRLDIGDPLTHSAAAAGKADGCQVGPLDRGWTENLEADDPAFGLRMYSYDRISATPAEQEATVRQVRKRGLDTAGLDDAGRYCADFYLSRPTTDTVEPLAQLLAGAVQP